MPLFFLLQLILMLKLFSSHRHPGILGSSAGHGMSCYISNGSHSSILFCNDHLIGLVVKVSAARAEDPGFESRLRRDVSGSSHTNDLKMGTPMATLPCTWCYRVNTGNGQPSVSILWLGEVESLICSFYLSVAAHKIVWADPSLRYIRMLLGR